MTLNRYSYFYQEVAHSHEISSCIVLVNKIEKIYNFCLCKVQLMNG